MLDFLERHLQALARDEAGLDEMRLIIGVLVEKNRLACFWSRLLRLGARWPETIGMELLPLASAKPVLTSLDTSYPAGEYLKSIFSKLGTTDRKAIERTILSIV
jgi:hypothetical protein